MQARFKSTLDLGKGTKNEEKSGGFEPYRMVSS